MQAKDAEFKQQLEAAGALETDLRAQLNVSLLLLAASEVPVLEHHPSDATPCSLQRDPSPNCFLSSAVIPSGVCCACVRTCRARPPWQDRPLMCD